MAKPVRVLLVEDNPGDAELIRDTLDADLLESCHLGANCYVAKPMDLSSFQFAVRAIEAFWTTVVKLPGRRERA